MAKKRKFSNPKKDDYFGFAKREPEESVEEVEESEEAEESVEAPLPVAIVEDVPPAHKPAEKAPVAEKIAFCPGRPTGAPPPEACSSEYETKLGYIYKLKKPIELSSGIVKKVFVPKPTHENSCRQSDIEYVNRSL